MINTLKIWKYQITWYDIWRFGWLLVVHFFKKHASMMGENEIVYNVGPKSKIALPIK